MFLSKSLGGLVLSARKASGFTFRPSGYDMKFPVTLGYTNQALCVQDTTGQLKWSSIPTVSTTPETTTISYPTSITFKPIAKDGGTSAFVNSVQLVGVATTWTSQFAVGDRIRVVQNYFGPALDFTATIKVIHSNTNIECEESSLPFLSQDELINSFLGYQRTTDVPVSTPQGHVVPSASSSFDLGSDTLRWGNLYSNTIRCNSINEFSSSGVSIENVAFKDNTITANVLRLNVYTPPRATATGVQLTDHGWQNVGSSVNSLDKYFLPAPTVGTIIYLNNNLAHSNGSFKVFANADGSSTYTINEETDVTVSVNHTLFVKFICITAVVGRSNWIAIGWDGTGTAVAIT